MKVRNPKMLKLFIAQQQQIGVHIVAKTTVQYMDKPPLLHSHSGLFFPVVAYKHL